MATVISELTGEAIDTNSDAWRHECELAWLLANKPKKADKHLHVYGVPDRGDLFELDRKTGQQVIKAEFADRGRRDMPMSIYKTRGLERADRFLEDAKLLYRKRQEVQHGQSGG